MHISSLLIKSLLASCDFFICKFSLLKIIYKAYIYSLTLSNKAVWQFERLSSKEICQMFGNTGLNFDLMFRIEHWKVGSSWPNKAEDLSQSSKCICNWKLTRFFVLDIRNDITSRPARCMLQSLLHTGFLFRFSNFAIGIWVWLLETRTACLSIE